MVDGYGGRAWEHGSGGAVEDQVDFGQWSSGVVRIRDGHVRVVVVHVVQGRIAGCWAHADPELMVGKRPVAGAVELDIPDQKSGFPVVMIGGQYFVDQDSGLSHSVRDARDAGGKRRRHDRASGLRGHRGVVPALKSDGWGTPVRRVNDFPGGSVHRHGM